MKNRTMKRCLLIVLSTGVAIAASALNQSYTGNGADPNDWFDTGNWSGGAYPVGGGDNALFPNAGKGITLSQSVPEFGQMQVGRGVANTVTLATGAVVTNLNQTVVSISAGSNTGAGTLVVDGGSLRTVRLRSAVSTGVVPNSLIQMKSGLLQVYAIPATDPKGDISIGELAYSTFELSGGTVVVDNEINITRGLFNVIGDNADITIGDAFNFGTIAASASRLGYELSLDRGVSTIKADSFSYLDGTTRELIIDGDNANPGAFSITLLSLATDTFSGTELTALQGILNTSNISGGSLSLANADQDLVFTGTVIPEPATLGMIALTGGAMLFLRRLMI